jgi:heterodisulfide reductase subunit B
MKLNYYPGCSATSTGQELDLSVRAVLAALGVELQELEDWSCCGASSAHATNRALAVALPARNLAIAQRSGLDLLAPCAACYSRLKTADYVMRHDATKKGEVEAQVAFEFTGSYQVRSPIDVVVRDIGLDAVRSRVLKPLAGLKAVGYYGCLLVRPPEVVAFDDPEHPVMLDQILGALGMEVCRWSYATDCCGGGLNLTKSSVAVRLVGRLTQFAREAGADAIVTACPLCQMSLEMRQTGNGSRMPVVYFTELMGLAFGLKETSGWWKKHLVDPRPWLGALAAGGA